MFLLTDQWGDFEMNGWLREKLKPIDQTFNKNSINATKFPPPKKCPFIRLEGIEMNNSKLNYRIFSTIIRFSITEMGENLPS